MPARRQSSEVRIVPQGETLWVGVDAATVRAAIGEHPQQRAPTTKDIVDLAIGLQSPRLDEYSDTKTFGKAAMQQVGKIQRALMLGVLQEDGRVKYGQKEGLWSEDAQAKLVNWLTIIQHAIADKPSQTPMLASSAPPIVAASTPEASQPSSVGLSAPSSPECQPSSPEAPQPASPDPDASTFSPTNW